MSLDGDLQRQLLVFGTLSGLAVEHVAGADEGDRADHAAGFPIPSGQHADLGGRVVGGRHHGRPEAGQQAAAFAQYGHRVVIAAEQQQRHSRALQPDHQIVVQLAGIAGWRAGVENVAGNQHRIHRVFHDLREQPVDQRLMFSLAALAHEMLTQVPVGSVKNAHVQLSPRCISPLRRSTRRCTDCSSTAGLPPSTRLNQRLARVMPV